MRNDQFGSLDLGFKVDETPIVIDSPRPLDFWGMSKKSASKKPWIILENSCLYIWSIFERKRSLSNYYVLEVMGWVKQGPILRSDTKITYISSQSLVWKIVVLKRIILDLYELFYIKFTISLLESRNGISEIDCSVKNKICKNFSRFFFTEKSWDITLDRPLSGFTQRAWKMQKDKLDYGSTAFRQMWKAKNKEKWSAEFRRLWKCQFST